MGGGHLRSKFGAIRVGYHRVTQSYIYVKITTFLPVNILTVLQTHRFLGLNGTLLCLDENWNRFCSSNLYLQVTDFLKVNIV